MSQETGIRADPAGAVVEVQFTPQPGDYGQSIRAFYARDRRILLTMGLCGLMLAWGIFNVAQAGRLTLMSLYLLLFPIVLAAFLWWGMPLALGRRVRRDSRLRSPTTWEIGDAQVTMRNEFGESRLEWTTFGRVVETKAHYLLTYSAYRGAFALLPRRAFASAEQEAAFREIVRRHLPGLRANP